jgi:hypothetical protein
VTEANQRLAVSKAYFRASEGSKAGANPMSRASPACVALRWHWHIAMVSPSCEELCKAASQSSLAGENLLAAAQARADATPLDDEAGFREQRAVFVHSVAAKPIPSRVGQVQVDPRHAPGSITAV